MKILKNLLTLIGMFSILIIPFNLVAQPDLSKLKGEIWKITEIWEPEPMIIIPGNTNSEAPSDAII